MKKDGRYYIVHEDALPEGLKRVCFAQRLLMGGKVKTVAQAAAEAGISRSAYYKYRDSISPFAEGYKDSIITLQAVLENRSGVLSNFLNMVAKAGGNVVTVNQNIPLGGVAGITLAVNTAQMKVSREALIKKLLSLSGVESVALMLEE